jgi:phosphate-selective porin OprO/OprP
MLINKKIGTVGRASLLAVSVAAASSAYADDQSNYQAIDRRIQNLEQQLQALKDQAVQDRANAAKTVSVSTSAPVLAAVPQVRASNGVRVSAGQDGFGIASDDGQYTLNFHALVQADGRFNLAAPNKQGLVDTFTLRRVEPSIQGQLTDLFSYNITPEYGGSPTSSVSADMYGEFHFQPQYLNVRIGKFKEPFGLENLQSASNLAFVERGFPSNLSPNRDLGVQVAGTLGNKQLIYAFGVFNGAPDGGDASTTDIDNHKEFAARLFAQPWHDGSKGLLDQFGFGIASTIGRENNGAGIAGTNGILPSIKTPAQNTFFQYSSTAVADGLHTRISPQANYYYDGFSALAEYVVSRQAVAAAAGKQAINVKNTAQELTLGYILTGENASYSGVKPLRPYSLSGDGWGAFEIVARAGRLSIDKDAFSNGLVYSNPSKPTTAMTAAQQASSVGLGLNWYLNRNAKLVFDYEHTYFNGGAGTVANPTDRSVEHAILLRSQYSF